jgi:tetratricopeptide (TPR) repeat protein
MIVPEMTRADVGLGYGFVWKQYPTRSCDWIEQHDVRGRAFNPFSYGGYLLWRFFPDTTRLPFIDIHQAGTPLIRYEYAYAGQDSLAWHVLDHDWRFDWVVMMRGPSAQVGILDFLDADSTWALVFEDDATALYLRRDGRDSTQARRWGFHLLPAGARALGELGERAWRDTTVRRQLDAEVGRALESSEWNGRAHALAANLALQDGRWADAAQHLRRAIALETGEKLMHGRLGLALLPGGEPAGALAEFEAEHRADPKWDEYDLRRGQALEALGRREEAREAYQRALLQPATSSEARDSLTALRPH